MFFSVVVTVYFWCDTNIKVPESSHKALRIMQITTVMVAILLIWCPITLLVRGGAQLPPLPTPSTLHLTKESLGWLYGTVWAKLWFVVMIVAFGHSLLAMSGFETLAQVYREVAYPKLKNLRITANIVCTYAVICTGVISLLAVMIIPDATRSMYYDNMIGGLVMNLSGPALLKLGFHVFVVIVGVLILAGAVNTSLIGVNGILNRVAEDGVLLDWFRHCTHKQVRDHLPHPQHDDAAPDRDHYYQPRRRVSVGRSLRLRRGVELRAEGPGSAGAALPAPRSGIQVSV